MGKIINKIVKIVKKEYKDIKKYKKINKLCLYFVMNVVELVINEMVKIS